MRRRQLQLSHSPSLRPSSRRWLNYDSSAGQYRLTPEQAAALAGPDGAVNVPGAFTLALGALRAVPRMADAFRTGAGVGWHEQDQDVFVGCEEFFRSG